jgi:hypothetical protein
MVALMFVLLAVAAAIVIDVSDGSFVECDRGDCGALGEFTMEQTWPLVPLGFLAVSLAFAWLTRRRGRPPD